MEKKNQHGKHRTCYPQQIILSFMSSVSLNEHAVSQTRSQEIILESFFLTLHIQSISKFFEFFYLIHLKSFLLLYYQLCCPWSGPHHISSKQFIIALQIAVFLLYAHPSIGRNTVMGACAPHCHRLSNS